MEDSEDYVIEIKEATQEDLVSIDINMNVNGITELNEATPLLNSSKGDTDKISWKNKSSFEKIIFIVLGIPIYFFLTYFPFY